MLLKALADGHLVFSRGMHGYLLYSDSLVELEKNFNFHIPLNMMVFGNIFLSTQKSGYNNRKLETRSKHVAQIRC